MNELQIKQLVYLDEVKDHFNSSNRAAEITNGCQYQTEDGRGCAIGFKIEDKELCKKLDTVADITSVSNKIVFDLLPLSLQEYGQLFLSHLQDLHDTSQYWNQDGLSERGKVFYNKIKLRIENNEF